jgi:hypothetical protein
VSLVVLVQAFFPCYDYILSMHGRFLLDRSVSDGATVGGAALVAHRCLLAPASRRLRRPHRIRAGDPGGAVRWAGLWLAGRRQRGRPEWLPVGRGRQ